MFEQYDDIMSIDDVAAALKIGHTQVYRILRSGQLNGYKEGKDWKIAKLALENYVREKSKVPLIY
ncbi:MAG: helix-turn-helix domain-containing protein [Lachnospiraceae bacterium]|nr:helix-turn-helix domain-containing protein [Lachnospiraceae bacterium]